MTQPATPPAATPPAAGTAPAAPAAPAASETPEDVAAELAATRRELAEARREAAKFRTTARDAQTAATATLSDAEKAAQALAERERKADERERAAVERENVATVSDAARALGFRDPRDAWAMVRDDLDRNDDGTVKNPDKALRDLLKDKPYLGTGTPAATDAGAGRSGSQNVGRSFNDTIRAATGRG